MGLNYYGDISNSYSLGAVTGYEYAGGLVGSNGEHSSIVNCYSAGVVSGTVWIGGLVGHNEYSSVITSSYFYIVSGDNGHGTALDNMQLRDKTSFVGFDFAGDTSDGTNDYWTIEAGYMPRLSWQDSPGFEVPLDTITTTLIGSGYPNDPFIIANKADLTEFRNNSTLRAGYYSLTSDINLVGTIYYTTAFVPEGFYGSFSGNGYTISNLTINGSFRLGFFGKLYGDVNNLALEDVLITGSSVYVGGLVSENYSTGSITSCYLTGRVTGCLTSYKVGQVGCLS